MDILKRLINVITLCWLTATSVFFYGSCMGYLEYEGIFRLADGSSSFDISTAKLVEPYSLDFDALVFILGFGAAILAFNYIFFKKPTLWHKTK
jgi:hypothetical protein